MSSNINLAGDGASCHFSAFTIIGSQTRIPRLADEQIISPQMTNSTPDPRSVAGREITISEQKTNQELLTRQLIAMVLIWTQPYNHNIPLYEKIAKPQVHQLPALLKIVLNM